MKTPMMYEKMATPPKSTPVKNSRSTLDLGAQSPKPTVLRVVKAKYITIIVFSIGVFSSSPYSFMNPIFSVGSPFSPYGTGCLSVSSQKMYQNIPMKQLMVSTTAITLKVLKKYEMIRMDMMLLLSMSMLSLRSSSVKIRFSSFFW